MSCNKPRFLSFFKTKKPKTSKVQILEILKKLKKTILDSQSQQKIVAFQSN